MLESFFPPAWDLAQWDACVADDPAAIFDRQQHWHDDFFIRMAESVPDFDVMLGHEIAMEVRRCRVEPGKYRAYGYEAPGHLLKDVKLKWREIKIGLRMPPEGSSPSEQQKLGLNKDATLTPRKSEGERLREP